MTTATNPNGLNLDAINELTRLRTEVSRQKIRLENDYKTITGLASGYDVLHLLDVDSGDFMAYYVENSLDDDPRSIMNNYADFYEAYRNYINAYCHPDYRTRMLRYCDKETIRKKLNGKKRFIERVLVNRDNGQWTWNEFVWIKFDDIAKDASEVAVGYTDVDDFVRAEQAREEEESRLKVLSDYLVDSYISAYYIDLKDRDYVILKTPEHFEFQQTDYLEAVQAFIEHYVAEEDRPAMRDAVQPATIVRRLAEEQSYSVTFNDLSGGTPRTCRFQVIRGADSDHAALAFMDITDEIRKEQERIQAIEEARVAEESQNERYNFLINVAHELRTPLTLILGPVRRLTRTATTDDNTRATLSKVTRQAERMATLLNTVLTTNRLDNGADSVHPEPIALNEWVESSADEFRDEAAGHNITISVATDSTIDTVPMDEHLGKIVFSNLMINAIRYTYAGTALEVSTRWSDNHDAVRVSVRDYGPGVGDIDTSKLFNRYYRATEEKTGFGIGLAYSKTIVDAHNGRIGAYNNPDGRGATFWFELPADYSTHADAKKKEEEVVYSNVARPYLNGRTILYAEDDHDMAEFVRAELGDNGLILITAPNGRRALEQLERFNVDLVLTDVMMPDINGLELCRIIKETQRYRHIPVLMLTARADEKSMQEGYNSKVDGYVSKPFETEDLLDVIERTLKAYQKK